MVLGNPMMHHSQGSRYTWAQRGLPGRIPSRRCNGFCPRYCTSSREWFLLVSIPDFHTCDLAALKKIEQSKQKDKDMGKCFWLGEGSLKALMNTSSLRASLGQIRVLFHLLKARQVKLQRLHASWEIFLSFHIWACSSILSNSRSALNSPGMWGTPYTLHWYLRKTFGFRKIWNIPSK